MFRLRMFWTAALTLIQLLLKWLFFDGTSEIGPRREVTPAEIAHPLPAPGHSRAGLPDAEVAARLPDHVHALA